MINTIYIIGEIPLTNYKQTRNKFDDAQLLLEDKGFRVFNPMDEICNSNKDFKFAIKANIAKLMRCNSVYILPCISIDKTQNIELLLAIALNLYILQGI